MADGHPIPGHALDDVHIDPDALDRMRREGVDVAILDVREPWEIRMCGIEGSVLIPLNELPRRFEELPRTQPLAVMCHHGVRSLSAALWLRERGFDNAVNLAGGIDAWAATIDPTMRRY
ncbi:rhodanese-like domain-containing protein [Inquilinus sp. CAU 1745]|uniref:rhodanese-like domain-containing protein n=1 Tax=Inquilinus sp. CAU 1745 TaxID=3140369 RepID=UPI00325B1FEF